MKKKHIISAIGTLSFVALASAATYTGIKVAKKMKPYLKKYHLKGNELHFDSEFESDSIAINCGHLVLDFKDATLKDNLGTLKVFGHASKISIIVPSDWIIKTIGTAKNSRIVNQLDEDIYDNHPTLIIKHDLHFSKLDIVKETVWVDELLENAGGDVDPRLEY